MSESAKSAEAGAALIIIWALAVQAAHMVEHVAQVAQKYVLMMQQARGFLGAVFDLEWVHFAYNAGLEFAFVAALLLWRRTGRFVPLPLTALVLLQGYHVAEHIVKMVQYYAFGITMGPKGILGHAVPLIWLHFMFNLVVLALIVLVWDYTHRAQLRATPAVA